MEGFESLPWATITPLGTLLVIVLIFTRMILSGQLVPRTTVTSLLESHVTANERLEQALRYERDGHNETRRQVSILAESGRVTDPVLQSIRAGEAP